MSIEDRLCTLLEDYCEEQGLQCMSADDMVACLELTPEQERWLRAYSELWDATFDPAPPVHLSEDERREPNERPVSSQTGLEE